MKNAFVFALGVVAALLLSGPVSKWVTTAGKEFVVISAMPYTAGGRPGSYDNRCLIVARMSDNEEGRFVFDVPVKDGIVTGYKFRTSFGRPVQPRSEGKRHYLRVGPGTIRLDAPGHGCI
jgi:hypothetical protein